MMPYLLFPKANVLNTTAYVTSRFCRRLTHAKSLNRYLTNKDYKRVCPECGKPNILPIHNCTYCETALPDTCIKRLLHDPLTDAIIGTGNGFTELYKDFNLIVVKSKYPISNKHVLVIPKKGLYDLLQLKRADLKLLYYMQQKAFETFDIHPSHAECSQLTMGFNYPSEYSHVCMHAAIPPFRKSSCFQMPYFYSFERIVKQIKEGGRFLPNFVRLTQRKRYLHTQSQSEGQE